MNIPTHCTNCETTEGVRFQCKGCNFAKFCSRDCQKSCWKRHKHYCMPLIDAVNDSIEKLRPLLKGKYRIDNQDLHCMFCLEGGTSEDPLFHSGCACRPDSGMGVGHIKCFQEFARASFADEKKQQRIDCGIDQCSHCFQSRNGILRFEMALILSKLYDPESLTRQSIQDIDNAFVTNNALVCLNWVLVEADHIDSAPSHVRYSRLRILLLMKDVNKQNHYPDNYYRIKQVFAEDKQIGNILIDIRKYQAAIDYNRQSYENFCDLINQYPALKSSRSSVVHTYARSLFEIYIASLQSDIGIDPPYHYLEVAERLMREDLEHPDDLPTLANNTCLLCSILMCQNKHTEAKQILSPCIEKSQRVLGPSHMVTKRYLHLMLGT